MSHLSTSIKWHIVHISCRSDINIGESPIILKQSKSFEAQVPFTRDWQQKEDSVQQVWAEDKWKFKDHMEYISSLQNKWSDWSRCKNCKIDQLYSNNVATFW